MITKIKSLAAANYNELVAIRRHLHKNPELSFQEFKTSEFVASKLTEFGVPFTKGIVKTGIVALIQGKNPSKKTIALRADLDALPINEQNNVEYRSCNPGIMHACGHDVHTASLLGAAKILNELKNEFEGTIKLIFQPGEEKLPGGASLMIKEGILENPKPTSIIGQHVYPSMEAGKVGFKNGMYMASTDELYLTVKGKGGHAAMPGEYNNPLIIASQILIKLNDYFMPSKNSELRTSNQELLQSPTVLAFGKITGNGATNVIPDEVKIEGTFRAMNEEWRAKAHEIMVSIANEEAKKLGGSCEFNIIKGYPFLVNDDTTTNIARKAAQDYLGAENVEEIPLRMTAEDFAWYSQQIPACFYRIGTASKARGITSGVHTATFDIDEKALEIGAGLFAFISLEQLRN